MKRILTIALFIGSFQWLSAQQLPVYTQYYNNEFLYNPSMTLAEKNPSLTMFYRKQWVSLEGDGLITKGVVMQVPVKTEKVGLGFQLFNDHMGIFDRNFGTLSYSYQIDLNEEHKLLLGLSAGYIQTRFDFGDYEVYKQIDPAIQNRIGDQINGFDANFGFTYKWKSLQVGMSIPHLLDRNLDFLSKGDNFLYYKSRHYVGSLSYKFELGSVSLRPLVLVRYHPALGVLPEGNLVADYDDKFWAAVSYRANMASAAIGFNLHEHIKLGYSYDMTLGDIGSSFGATHEITLTYRFGDVKPSENKPKETETKTTTEQSNLDDLLRQLKELRKRIEEQSDTLTDHESRIKALEQQKDSLKGMIQKEIEEQIKNERIGSGSIDIRDPNNPRGENYSGFINKIVDPEDTEALYGRHQDGTPIKKNENYSGTIYGKDKKPLNTTAAVKLYTKDGKLITDPDNYEGDIYNVNGVKIATKKLGERFVSPNSNGGGGRSGTGGTGSTGGTGGTGGRSSTGGTGGTGGTGSTGGTGGIGGSRNGTSGATTGTGTEALKTYSKDELAKSGIRYTAPGNYLIVSSFRSKENALSKREALEKAGIDAGIVYNHYRQWFYVYTLNTNDFDEVIDQLKKTKAAGSEDAWVHVILE